MTDEEQIRHLHAMYAQVTDAGNSRGKSELFAEDGRYYPTSGEFIGRAVSTRSSSNARPRAPGSTG